MAVNKTFGGLALVIGILALMLIPIAGAVTSTLNEEFNSIDTNIWEEFTWWNVNDKSITTEGGTYRCRKGWRNPGL